MAEALASLVREVERVVTAPYVPSLQDLYELVQHSSLVGIESWTLQKPCQVGLLADALVEGLSRSRVALPVLTVFASMPRFRDALLSRHPVILDAFLEKAVDAGDTEYHPACVALLSSPLPPGVVPPARLAGFITKLVSIMAAKPCSETVAPLHTLMSSLGSSSRILDEVPTEVMSNLQLEFTKTLRNLDDHMGNLLCLAAFARVASTRNESTYNQHGPEPPSWLLNIQHFFGPKRGLKTLDLVVLRVILACSANCNNLTPSQAAESIRLAICIADAVDPAQRECWIAANSSKIAKLCEKVSRNGLDREIQVMGIAFLLSLRTVAALPPQIRDLGLRILASRDSQSALISMPPHVVSRLTASLATCDESIVYELLRLTVDALKDDTPGGSSFSRLHVADLLLTGLQSAEAQYVVSSLFRSDSTKETIASLLGRFPVAQKEANCQGSNVCGCAYSSLKNKTFLRLFEMYFAAALSQNGNDTDILVMKSLVRRVTTTFTQQDCSFSTSNTKDFRESLYVRGRHDFASAQHPARDWRSGVAEAFRQNAQASHENMMKVLGDVCFDLERCCYDVEGPLRSVEAERDRHAFEADQLRRQNEELDSQLRKSSSTISGLQQDLARLEEQAEGAYARIEDLSNSLDSAHEEAREQRRVSEETLHMERQTARTRELDLIATSTAKDDQLEELQEELRRVRSENEQLRASLDEASKEKATSSEASVSLQRELEEVKGLLETARAMCSQKEDEVKHLLTDKEDLHMEMGTMKQMTEEQNLEIERLYSSLQEAEEKLQIEVETLTHQHETAATQAATEIAKQKEENVRLQAAMQAAARDYTKESQSKEKRIQQLERKIQSLRNERATKAREFSEAQQHISRLMGVMGFVAKPAEPPASTRPNRTRSTSGRHSKYDEDEDTQLAESLDDLTCEQQGPIPKRPKGNRRSIEMSQVPPPKTPGSGPPRSNIPPATISRDRVARQPLTETDSNSPVKSQVTNVGKDSHDGAASPDKIGDHLQDFDLDMDLEFSKDFIFTSTAFSGSNEQVAPQ